MLAWLSVWSEVQMICIWSSWYHFHPIISCFIKIQIGLTFLVLAYTDCREAIKWVSVYCPRDGDRLAICCMLYTGESSPFSFSALTLLVGCQEWHLARRITCTGGSLLEEIQEGSCQPWFVWKTEMVVEWSSFVLTPFVWPVLCGYRLLKMPISIYVLIKWPTRCSGVATSMKNVI